MNALKLLAAMEEMNYPLLSLCFDGTVICRICNRRYVSVSRAVNSSGGCCRRSARLTMCKIEREGISVVLAHCIKD